METNITENILAQNTYQSAGIEKKGNAKKTDHYGKTIGKPELSDKAAEYYDSLKKKYGNMDFILVSRDQKETAKAQAGQYANPLKMVVLIDEDKIERMATDEAYRRQYESIIANAASGLSQMKSSIESTGAQVKGYGMQVNDGGLTSYFAVLKKSSADQKARIEKKAKAKKEAKKAEEKKAKRKEQEERLKAGTEQKTEKIESDDDYDVDEEDTVTITAGSLEELMKKISDYTQNEKMNSIQTESERVLGSHIDFKG